jgi:PIN domain nuclease of toxin-antitoxin system
MTYLLDTHYLIWAIADSKKISKKVHSLMVNSDNRIIVSTISFWEISLKSSLRKLTIEGFHPEELPAACEQVGFEILTLTASDSSSFHLLKSVHHKDPFDRMLIWQAIRNKFTLISADEQINKYASEGLKIF